ncbi:hypothetical protein ACTOB_003722 [Actinoplanes oblitus]|uniref:Uncharacterized protein n=1 Tax=Actinoplanes oblitus TaxID=3040509 RepID=A0ABY8WQA8_9ACTN|nr:hypothetical protein [Actinoplanes oblitus]WIN00046.1 hypothetical protein ACTOB_003722 [Actinoplanes oblitus]
MFSHWRHLPADTTPEAIADCVYRLFNADLDQLQAARTRADDNSNEMSFLAACSYRLLRLRSLSVGDVIGVTTVENTTWLACEPAGWRHIDSPEHITGHGLIPATAYEHLRRDRRA